MGGIGLKREGCSNRPIPQSQRMGAGANIVPSMGANDLLKTKTPITKPGFMVGGIGLEYHPLNRGQQPSESKTPAVMRECFFVGGIGLEPTTFAMSTQRSNQLS